MFHVIDHSDVVYSGDLSQSTQYMIDHYGNTLDDAIQSGIKIVYTDPQHGLNEARQNPPGNSTPDFWKPIEDWKLD